MRWPFKEWGASVVLAGHSHSYERIMIDDIPYFVNGAGGAELLPFTTDSVPGTEVRYNQDWGAMRVTANPAKITFEFITRAKVLIDSFEMCASMPEDPSAHNEFVFQQWATVSPAADWSFVAGDFTGDGQPDVMGYHPSNGTLWVGEQTPPDLVVKP